MTASSDTSFDIVTDTNYSQHFAFHGKHLRDIFFFTMKTSTLSTTKMTFRVMTKFSKVYNYYHIW